MVIRSFPKFVLAFAVTLLWTPILRAACDPNLYPVVTVSVGTWQSNGILPVTATNTYPRNDGFLESLSLYIDVVDTAHRVWGPTPVTSGSPKNVNVVTSCWPEGAHTIIAVGGNCIKSASASAGFSFSATTTVNASFGAGFSDSGQGTLQVDYSFPNTNDYRQREIIVERDGQRVAYRNPDFVSGSTSFSESIYCMAPGAHTYVIRARPCGDVSRESVVTLPLTVDTIPRLTVNMSAPDAAGNVTVTGGVTFPNSPLGPYAGDVYYYVNGEQTPRWHDNFYQRSQSLYPHSLNVACAGPYTVRVVANQCGGGTISKEVSGGTPGMTQPKLTLKRTGTDSTGKHRFMPSSIMPSLFPPADGT